MFVPSCAIIRWSPIFQIMDLEKVSHPIFKQAKHLIHFPEMASNCFMLRYCIVRQDHYFPVSLLTCYVRFNRTQIRVCKFCQHHQNIITNMNCIHHNWNDNFLFSFHILFHLACPKLNYVGKGGYFFNIA
jgi:hypothetical protein